MTEDTMELYQWKCDRCLWTEVQDETVVKLRCHKCQRWMQWSRYLNRNK
jgi:hypothetical protein